jgi:uncharacterized membrane protein
MTGNSRRAIRIASVGQAAYCATMITLGVLGFVKGGFVQIWTGVPKGLPARVALAYLCAIVSLGTGIGLLFRRTASVAARVLLAFFLLWMLAFRVPLIFRAPAATSTWWAIGETAAMAAAAWVLCVWFADGKGLRIARMLYGLALIPFGIAHFTYLDRTVGMVPGWLPGHVFWAYFFGWAFIAAGLAILAGMLAKPAALLSTVEMGLFTVLVWVPIVTAHPTADDWNEFIDSCALTAAAWVVADSYNRG